MQWHTGLKISDLGDSLHIYQNGQEYKARSWRLTPDLVNVIDTAIRYGLVANWTNGVPQKSYRRGGKDFEKGSHSIPFARRHDESWIMCLDGWAGPPNIRDIVFKDRYWHFIASTGVPYKWEHAGGHNVRIEPTYLDATLSKLTNDIIDAIEDRPRVNHNIPIHKNAGITNEYDLEIAFLDHLARHKKSLSSKPEIRFRYLDTNNNTRIPDACVDIRNGTFIVFEFKFGAGHRAHIDQLLEYLRLPGIMKRCRNSSLRGALVARTFDDELVQLVNASPQDNISLYAYGYNNGLELHHCAGQRLLEETQLL
jgi:hypothetical protein